MRKLRRCPAQDQCSKNADFCHFGLFWQNLDIEQKSTNSTFQQNVPHFTNALFFSTFFPTCFEEKVVFSQKKVTFTPKKKHFFRLYLQRALNGWLRPFTKQAQEG